MNFSMYDDPTIASEPEKTLLEEVCSFANHRSLVFKGHVRQGRLDLPLAQGHARGGGSAGSRGLEVWKWNFLRRVKTLAQRDALRQVSKATDGMTS